MRTCGKRRGSQRRAEARLSKLLDSPCRGAWLYNDDIDGGPWPWLAFTLGFGYLGVPLFFGISGFRIHLPHARAVASGPPAPAPAWRRFFARRFWRLSEGEDLDLDAG